MKTKTVVVNECVCVCVCVCECVWECVVSLRTSLNLLQIEDCFKRNLSQCNIGHTFGNKVQSVQTSCREVTNSCTQQTVATTWGETKNSEKAVSGGIELLAVAFEASQSAEKATSRHAQDTLNTSYSELQSTQTHSCKKWIYTISPNPLPPPHWRNIL
jgi:hypothetical protein